MKTFIKFFTVSFILGITNLLGTSGATLQNDNSHFLKYDQLYCLAKNVYFEAAVEGRLGQEAVAWVTLNRVQSERYPDTICDVIYQAHLDGKGNPIRNKCQFSWYCDGKADNIKDKKKFHEIFLTIENIVNNYYKFRDPTDGAVMYHAYYVNPHWSRAYQKTARIDSHIFYKEK
jgi:spore germination cell wall hydrolase CwlJ-like protein